MWQEVAEVTAARFGGTFVVDGLANGSAYVFRVVPIGAPSTTLPSSASLPVIPLPALEGGDAVTEVEIDGVTYRMHAFTTVGAAELTVRFARDVDVLVVGGGGGGGSRHAGGGGAGAFGELLAQPLTPGTAWTIVVGGGGVGGSASRAGTVGSASSITESGKVIIERAGGGGGSGSTQIGPSGASGGGGTGNQPPSGHASGQGNPGGVGTGSAGGQNCGINAISPTWCGGGGGGAGGAGGSAARGTDAGSGGPGRAASIITPVVAERFGVGEVSAGQVFFAAGGGGGMGFTRQSLTSATGAGAGGLGGGGVGGHEVVPGSPGRAATGSGGGGGGYNNTASGDGGPGGSGVVIVRYRVW